MKVVVTGGGTGGHVYPALAIAKGIKKRIPDAEILYVGTRDGLESTIVPKAGFDFSTIEVSGISRSSMLKASTSIAKFPRSIFQAWSLVRSFQPDIVMGTGGYVSFPVVFAATLFPGCKTFIHEQNAYPGIANRNLAKRVDCTMLTFSEAAQHLKARHIEVTGLPVRSEIYEVKREEAYRKLGLDKNVFTLLVFGGSRGSASINRAMLKLVEEYPIDDMQVIWLTGDIAYEDILDQLGLDIISKNKRLIIKAYMHNIELAMAAADMAVCRSGASTLSELAVLGLPAILIPYPYAAENHQEKNARTLMKKKAVDMVIDEFLDGETLYNKIKQLKENENMKKEACPNALNKILDVVLK